MNTIEAAKAAGLSVLAETLAKPNHYYAISKAELERFAQIIQSMKEHHD